MKDKKSIPDFKGTITIGQAAEILGVSTMTLRRWDERGVLKPVRMGTRGDRRYKKEDIRKVLSKGIK